MALLTQKSVKVLGIAGLVIFVAGGAAGIVQPLFNNIQTSASELQSVKDEIATMEQTKLTLEKAKADYPTVKNINTSLLAEFPELAQTPELLDVITLGAVNSGIDPSDISSITFAAPAIAVPVIAPVTPAAEGEKEPAAETPAAETPAATPTTDVSTGEFATLEVGISISGDPTEIEDFLNYINTMDRAFILGGFSIADSASGEGGKNQKTLSITGEVFIYKAVADPTQPVEETAPPEDGIIVEP